MSKTVRYLCLILCFILTISSVSFLALAAEVPTESVFPEPQAAYVSGENVNIRSTYSTSGTVLGKVSYGEVSVLASYTFQDGTIWYKITYGSITGYMHGSFVHIVKPVVPAGDFAAQLATFPEDYRSSLTFLHAVYPNWNFVADYIDLNFSDVVYNQTLEHRKLVNMTADGISWRALGPENFNWTTGKWKTYSGDWTDASKEVIAHYLDPRNFINLDSVYMFMQQSYREGTATEAELTEFVKDSFLGKGFPAEQDEAVYAGSYVKVILEAAKQANVNPYVLASTLMLEQGKGESDLISGTTEKYPGYYNFFNYKASGDDVVGNGLAYAKEKGWNSRSKSIIGGAKLYASGYIAIGQDTYYYKDFDVQDTSPYTHQYAQSIYDHRSSASLIRKVYRDKTSLALTFRIPVYKNMPTEKVAQPAENQFINNYYFTSIAATGLTPAFTMYTQKYTLKVSGNTTVTVKTPPNASYAGAASYALKAGVNTITLPVKAQTGYLNDYTLIITAAADCTLTVTNASAPTSSTPQSSSTPSSSSNPSSSSSNPSSSTPQSSSNQATSSEPEKVIMRGDANGDSKIDIIDLAAIRLHILGKRVLKDDAFACGDANKDTIIDIVDLAAVRLNILGKLKLN